MTATMRITPNPFQGTIQPLPQPPPAPPVVTVVILGWTFTRPPCERFDIEKYPGYWALHLADSAELIYSDETSICSTLITACCTHIQWFSHHTTTAVGYLHEGYACLVFRGTKKLADWGIDATSILWSSPGRHLGFHRAWRHVEPQVTQWLKTLPPNTELLTAGHSLGGALAVLSAFELSPTVPVRMVQTFGAPRVGSIDFRLAYNHRLANVTHQFRYGADVVTIIPPPPLFLHVSPGTGLQSSTLDQAQYPSTPLGVLGASINYTNIPTAMFAREPIAAFLLAALSLVVIYPHNMEHIFAHLPAWFSTLAHSRLREALLIAISIPLLEQLSYLIPIKIPFLLRCLLSIAVVAAVVLLHINILWIIPTLVWFFIIAVTVLRTLLPSGEDHHMAGYINALHRPMLDDPASRLLNPNNGVYTWLSLR